MDAFGKLTSKTFVLPDENIDTDQIIPARFLTTTSRDGLADGCFHDWRFDGSGKLTEHPLNDVETSSHQVLIAGDNFGCGSSREHAPWALLAFGFRVVISTEIADIFRSNSLKNGLLPVTVSEELHQQLMEHAGEEVTVDLEEMTIRHGNHVSSFEIEPFARQCLLAGKDSLDVLIDAIPQIEEYEAQRA